MNTATRILVNGWPRTVAGAVGGELSQTYVHSEGEFDLFFEHNRPTKNLYYNISRMRRDMRPVTGLVPFDFDSPLKESAFPQGTSDGEKISMMREDDDLAHEILGDVWDDAQKLVKIASENNVPVITVFSGLGIHSYLLYKERVNPTEEKVTTSKYYVEEANLTTWDRKVITDTKRILRIPNSQRIDENGPCGAWCIPMTEYEVKNNDITELLERCTSPKSIPEYNRYLEENRPEMKVYDSVELEEDAVGTVEFDGSTEVPENVEYIVKSCIPLPCVRERFLGKNPDHLIRFNGVVLLYQAGFSPSEVRNIIRKIGWVDYNESLTKKMTNQIWSRKYSENSCKTIQNNGLCVFGPSFGDRTDDPSDCETHGYTSGEALYPH